MKKKISNSIPCNGQAGFTLIELLVGLGVFGLLMVAAFSVLSIGSQLSGYSIRSASSSQFLADGLNQLTAILPQVVKINSCKCSGTGSALSDCTWVDSSPWLDPVVDGGVATGSVIFDAEFEAYYGGPGNINAGTGALAADETITATINNVAGKACGTHGYTSGITSRGCRLRAQLLYTAPTLEAGATPSRPGELGIKIFTPTTSIPALPTLKIGDASGALRQGLTGLSCGLLNPAAGQAGSTFVMNLRMKIKKSVSENPSDAQYESWHSTGKNFNLGFFRESKLRYSFANLFVRGAYQWRMISTKACKNVGVAATSAEACCSGAFNGATCVDCVASGSAGTRDSCCSEKAVGGICI